MFEQMTFENILQNALQKVPSDMDKRQGSIIYDALAPICAELAQFYIDLDVVINEVFADTASREFLVKRASERGIFPYKSTKSIILATLVGDFKLFGGERFNCEELNFTYTGQKQGEFFKMECESFGEIGNISEGELLPIDNIPNLEQAYISSISITARDEEDTESFRKRYFDMLKSQAFAGNRADYIKNVNAINGVGASKCYRAKDEIANVKVFIVDNNFNKASEELITLVKNTLDPQEDGFGLGLAPIGHIVSVYTVSEVFINIITSIEFKPGFSLSNMQTLIDDTIKAYLKQLRSSWANEDNLVVRISQIENRILNLPNVLDVSNTKINNSNQNLVLNENEIPVFGGVSS